MSAEIKTVGQLIDELITTDLKIWHLVDVANAGQATPVQAKQIQTQNNHRNELIRAIDRRVGERDIGAKVHLE